MKDSAVRLAGRALMLAAALVVLSSGQVRAEEAPATATAAKVMLLLDTSAAMNEAIYHEGYDPDTQWTGLFTGAEIYAIHSTRSYTPYSFKPTWPSTPSVVLAASDNGQAGLYSGNYLNWVFHHASAAQRAAIPQWTRTQVLKISLRQAVSLTEGIDFALMIFNGNAGGRLVADFGVTVPTLVAALSGLATDAYAPLAETAEDVLDRFRFDGVGAPFADPQQKCFCLIVTGSLPTMDLDVSSYLHDADGDGNDPGTCSSIGSSYPDSSDCSDHLDDVTWYMAHEDLRPDLAGPQTVSTYVVSLLVDNPLLRDAAANGNGQYYPVILAGGLWPSLDAALQDIIRRNDAPTPAPELPPAGPRLLPCRPNPFNPRTTIRFELAEAGATRLVVLDLAGRLLRTLIEAPLDRGPGSVVWDGRDDSGRDAAAGTYLLRLESGGEVVNGKLALLR